MILPYFQLCTAVDRYHLLSFLGKYVPAISYKIHKMNRIGAKLQIPLKGLAIGDGLCDPIHQMAYGDFLFQVGLLDENDRDELVNMTQLTRSYIKYRRWNDATAVSN